MATTVPYAGITCRLHGNVDIDYNEYMKQMLAPNSLWKCPTCGNDANFNDDRYEELHQQPEE